MQYFSADFIFDGYKFLDADWVIVMDDNFVVQDILPKTAQMPIQYFPGLLMPGMINAHCHIELSHLKALIPEHTGLVDFILQIQQRRHEISDDEKLQAMCAAEHEMKSQGIVAVGDISNSLDSLPVKKIKNLHYHTFVESVGLHDDQAAERFEKSCRIKKAFDVDHSSSIVMHAPYSVGPALKHLIVESEKNKITSTP